jgi:hypothetical protein
MKRVTPEPAEPSDEEDEDLNMGGKLLQDLSAGSSSSASQEHENNDEKVEALHPQLHKCDSRLCPLDIDSSAKNAVCPFCGENVNLYKVIRIRGDKDPKFMCICETEPDTLFARAKRNLLLPFLRSEPNPDSLSDLERDFLDRYGAESKELMTRVMNEKKLRNELESEIIAKSSGGGSQAK